MLTTNQQIQKGNLFKIVGQFKNPKFKPWEVVEPMRDLEAMWDFLKKENAKIEIEEIGERTVLNIVWNSGELGNQN